MGFHAIFTPENIDQIVQQAQEGMHSRPKERISAAVYQEHVLYLLAELERSVKKAAPFWDAGTALAVRRRLDSVVSLVRHQSEKADDK